jgi:hypothetical protein
LVGNVGDFVEKTPENDKTDQGEYQQPHKENRHVPVSKYVVFVSKVKETENWKEEKKTENEVQFVGQCSISKGIFSQPFIEFHQPISFSAGLP